MASPLLSSLFAGIESNFNPNAVSPTGATGEYQQFPAFQTDYGVGEAGVTNYVNKAVSANPNVSIGDVYAEYHNSTSNPGFGPVFSDLSNPVQTRFNNFAQYYGLSPSTPAADVIGVGGVDTQSATSLSAPDVPNNIDFSTFTVPDTSQSPLANPDFSQPGTIPDNSAFGSPFQQFFGIDPFSGNGGTLGIGPGSGTFSSSNPGTGGNASSFFTTVENDVINFLTRFGLIVLGIVVIAIGGVAVVRGESLGQTVRSGAGALKEAIL